MLLNYLKYIIKIKLNFDLSIKYKHFLIKKRYICISTEKRKKFDLTKNVYLLY